MKKRGKRGSVCKHKWTCLILALALVFLSLSPQAYATESEHEHSYTVTATTEPTCEETGTQTYTCGDCGDSYTETIDANGHTWNGNICSVCGAVKESDLSQGSVSLSKTRYAYNGSKRTPSVKVTLNGTTLKKGTDYSVSYKNNKAVGTATVTVKGIGSYTGTVKKTFKIVPKKVKITDAASYKSGRITIQWKKVSGATKYQIAYKKAGNSKWKYKYADASSCKKVIKNLSAGKKYKIKVRAYKKASGKTYCGKWSDVQTVKCKSEKIVYLTFDDGPSENMGEILDILDQYNVKATFFVTGNNASYRYLIKKAYKKGHAIGLHSYSHNYSKIYRSKSAFYKDLNKISNLVEDLTGEQTTLLRFPGGSSNTVSRHYSSGIMTKLTKSVTKDGYTYFDWNCDSTDASGNNIPVSTIVKNATSSSANEVNILLHSTDAKDTTVKALPKIIKYYKKKGYSFEVLTPNSYNAHHSVNN